MELSSLKGIGPTRLARFRAMGINTLRDLLFFFPKKYEDHIHVTTISSAEDGAIMVHGTVVQEPKISYYHGISVVSTTIQDDSGSLLVRWYNEPWMMQQLSAGQILFLYGNMTSKKGRYLQNPKIITQFGFMPVYRAIRGYPNKSLQQLLRNALYAVETVCPETLPSTFLHRNHLISLSDALRNMHFPDSLDDLKKAIRRIEFERMLMYLMGVSIFRHLSQPGFTMGINGSDEAFFWENVPFIPTAAQRRVLHEISEDLKREQAMSRLVQGDVGCGKTIIAFGAIYLTVKQGYQAAMMAPTDILARQHYENALSILRPLGISCELLTGNTKAAERRRILNAIKDHTCQAIFGTHALISAGVKYDQLGLVITDEQHRFGVRQRSALQNKGISEGRVPHVLVMSATPIPRTMALILYGDLKISIIDELPPGRKPVKTRLVPADRRKEMYRFLRDIVRKGQQAYIVCPLVEDSEKLHEMKSARSLYTELISEELKDIRVGLTWGNQNSEEKEETLRLFSDGKLDVLIATTVIEVGVNVPNATVMIIENAERYGLSQLHQLRGRIGRGSNESWCFLLSESTNKLHILCETNDGFLIAQKDLELRGPGDLMGTRQSGEEIQKIIGRGDAILLNEVQNCVNELEINPVYHNERIAIESLVQEYFSQNEIKIALN